MSDILLTTTVGSFANVMPVSSSRLCFFVLRSKSHTASMSVTHSRLPFTQMPLGLFIVSGKTRASSMRPSGATLLMNPRPSFSAGFSCEPPNWLT